MFMSILLFQAPIARQASIKVTRYLSSFLHRLETILPKRASHIRAFQLSLIQNKLLSALEEVSTSITKWGLMGSTTEPITKKKKQLYNRLVRV